MHSGLREPCTIPDVAGTIDTLEDELQERFRLTADQARLVADWHRGELDHEDEHLQGHLVNRIVARLLERGNIRLKAIGLAFAAGLNRLNGWPSERAAARDSGFTVASINSYKLSWIDYLELPHNEHCKSEQSRKIYRQSATDNHWRRRKTITQTN